MKKLLRAVTLALALFSIGAVAAGDPNLAFQAFVNGKVVQNGRGLITGQTLNQAFNLLPPVFYSMGSWDVNGNFTLNSSSLPLGIPPANLDLTNITLTASTNAALKLLPTTLVSQVTRVGFSAAGDSVAVPFTASASPCSLNAGAGDDGSQVRSFDGKCWISALPNPVDARIFGFKGDGTDQTPILQNVANAVCARSPSGGQVLLPFVTFVMNGASSVSHACPIDWAGSGWNEVSSGGGTWLHITGTTASPFSLTSQGARGSRFRRLGIYQDQPAPAAGWAPTVYPPVFNENGVAGMVTYSDLLCAPCYDLIKADNSGRLDASNISGQVLHNPYWLDRSYDTSHFTGRHHFWPFWSADANVLAWQIANADIFALGRVDGLDAPDVFLYGYRSGIRLFKSPTADPAGLTGFATKIHVGSLYCDSAKFCVWNPQSGGGLPFQYPQVRVETMSFAGLSPDGSTTIANAAAVQVDAAGGMDIDIGRLSSETTAASPVVLANTVIPTRFRVGSMNVSSSPSGPGVSAVSGANDDIGFGTQPTMGGNKPIVSNVSANVTVPLANGGIANMTSGGSFTLQNDRKGFAVTSGSTVASYTINLPPSPFDGMEQYISPLASVTSLTVNAASGQTVLNPPTSLTAGSPVSFIYFAGASQWVRR